MMEYKYFIKRFLLFIIPLAFLLVFLEFSIRKIPSSYVIKKQYFEKTVDSIEALVLGNSHMLHGVNPDYFSVKGFNLASGFQNYFYDKALTLPYLNRLKKLKIVFISADYISFYYRIKDVADWIDYGYYRAWNVKDSGLSIWDSRNYSTFMLYTPSKSLDYVLKGDKKALAKNLKPNGFNPEDSAANEVNVTETSGKTRANYHTKIIKFSRQEESLNHLESLITELQKRNIRVVLLAPPVYTTYSKHCDTAIINRTNTIISSVVSKYKCQYRDYSTDQRFVQTDFHDNDHLNYSGAAKFTRMLDDDFVKPLLLTQVK
jgi:hypothetical protein